MKIIPTCLFILSSTVVFAQNAPFRVVVKDFENKPIIGEQILFEDPNGRSVGGVTNGEGWFETELPGGETYEIKVKSVGVALDYSELEVPALEGDMSFMKGEVIVMIQRPKQLILHNVHFDSGKSNIRSTSHSELDELVTWLTNKPELTVEISGHTDNVGDDGENLSLSQRRSESIKQYLISKGINQSRLIPKGYGESQPIASNNTPEGRQMNRRTEILIQ